MKKSGWRQFVWPEAATLEHAVKYCRMAGMMALMSFCIKAVELTFTKLDFLALGEAITFLVLGILMFRCSRVAAVSLAALSVWYAGFKLMPIFNGENPPTISIWPVIFMWVYIQGVRGAFSFEKLKSIPSKAGPIEDSRSAA